MAKRKVPVIEAVLGCMHVKVYVDPGDGWAEYRMPHSKRLDVDMILYIGAEPLERRVLSILLHEAFEAYCDSMQMTWTQAYASKQCAANKLIMLSHAQMDEAIEDVADFVTTVFPVVKKAWRAARRVKKEGEP